MPLRVNEHGLNADIHDNSDLLSNNYKVFTSKFFLLADSDTSIFGLRGLTIIAPLMLALVTLALWLSLTKTKSGVAMRGAVENPSLAGVLGINIERVYLVSWWWFGWPSMYCRSYSRFDSSSHCTLTALYKLHLLLYSLASSKNFFARSSSSVK